MEWCPRLLYGIWQSKYYKFVNVLKKPGACIQSGTKKTQIVYIVFENWLRVQDKVWHTAVILLLSEIKHSCCLVSPQQSMLKQWNMTTPGIVRFGDINVTKCKSDPYFLSLLISYPHSMLAKYMQIKSKRNQV